MPPPNKPVLDPILLEYDFPFQFLVVISERWLEIHRETDRIFVGTQQAVNCFERNRLETIILERRCWIVSGAHVLAASFVNTSQPACWLRRIFDWDLAARINIVMLTLQRDLQIIGHP